MNKPREFDFEAALQLEPAYQPSERFFEAFYIFGSRLESLQRYFEFSSQYIESYLSQSRESLAKVREHPAAQQGGNLVRIDRIVFGFAAGGESHEVSSFLRNLVFPIISIPLRYAEGGGIIHYHQHSGDGASRRR